MNRQRTLILGGTLFTMLFGAGNIVLPLILGRTLGEATPIAMIGFIITAVWLPLLGFTSIMLVKGDYIRFLESLGKIPAFIVAALCMILLGPVGAIPRCIALAHADLSWYFPGMPISIFTIIAALVIGACTFQKSNMMDIIGRFLSPVKIICLLSIAMLGVIVAGEVEQTHHPLISSFSNGFLSGYGTLDLLAVIFFSQFLYSLMAPEEGLKQKEILKRTLRISLIAGVLMSLVYVCFAGVAVLHGSKIPNVADDTLLSALASVVLGPKAGIFANLTIALTCLTSAIALSASFADFLSRFVFRNKISYRISLFFTIALSALFANLRFTGIMKAIIPAVSLLYPALVVFSAIQLFTFLTNRKSSRLPRNLFFITLGITVLNHVFNL